MAEVPATGTPSFTVSFAVERPLAVITLAGDIGIEADDDLQTAFRSAAGVKRVRFRFAPGATINSAGIAVLITLTSQARKARQIVEVSGLSPHYRKIFDMIGLTEYVKMVD